VTAIWFIGRSSNIAANENDEGIILVRSSGAARMGRTGRR